MIKPDKHTNPRTSIAFLSAAMLSEIKKSGIIKYDELKNDLKDKFGKSVSENFEFTLSLLFLFGKIEYLADLDSIKAVHL